MAVGDWGEDTARPAVSTLYSLWSGALPMGTHTESLGWAPEGRTAAK